MEKYSFSNLLHLLFLNEAAKLLLIFFLINSLRKILGFLRLISKLTLTFLLYISPTWRILGFIFLQRDCKIICPQWQKEWNEPKMLEKTKYWGIKIMLLTIQQIPYLSLPKINSEFKHWLNDKYLGIHLSSFLTVE